MLRTKDIVFISLISIKFILQFIIVDPGYELHRDEFLHLDQADHLALGYQSVPPFTSWTSLIIKWLGGGIFWVRFFPALFGTITIALVWKLTGYLRGGLFAQVLAASGLIFSALLRLNILYQPNSADVLFWTACFYHLVRYFQTEKNKYLYFTGICLGLGMLNKYNIIFCIAGLIPALLVTRQRNIFLKKELYLAAGIALLIFSPNLIWQIQNNFPVFGHMRELAERQLVNVKTGDFFKEQVLYFIGSIYIWTCGLFGLLFFKPFERYRWLGFSYFFTIIIFVILKAKGYYGIGLYPVLFCFGALFIEAKTGMGWLRKIRYAFVIIPALVLAPIFKIVFPLLSPAQIKAQRDDFSSMGLLRWEDGQDHDLPQDFADMLGWKQLAAAVDQAYAIIPEKENTLVFCDNYGQAGAINYYSKNKSIHAVTFNADYKKWFPWDMKIKHVIRVKEKEDDDDLGNEKSLFKTVTIIKSITDSSAREFGTRVILLKDATTDITKVLRDELNERNDQ
jgi:hypothetical protein